MSTLRRRVDNDGWELPVADAGVRVQVDYALTLLTTDGFAFRIERPLILTDSHGREHRLVPDGDPRRLAPALALARTTLISANAFDDGRLELSFDDASKIQVSCGEDFEPWEAYGPEGLKLVAVPGGELSVWR